MFWIGVAVAAFVLGQFVLLRGLRALGRSLDLRAQEREFPRDEQ